MLAHDYLKVAPNFTIIDAVANHWQSVIITIETTFVALPEHSISHFIGT